MRFSLLKKVILLPIIWFFVHTLAITADGLLDEKHPADAALILGNTVYPNGSLSERLRGRLDKGLKLYRTGQVKKLVVSGGLGKEGQYEADAMKKYLLAAEVPEQDIVVDNKGFNTFLSAKNYQQLQEVYHFRSVIAVSQFYHITRTKLMLRKMGIQQVYGAHADYFEMRDFYAVFREFFAFYRYLFL